MSAFDKIIGYDSIKEELLQVCDMIRNREIYSKLGAKTPSGILLYGAPGLGKTLMAQCFIQESGLHAFTIRRNKGGNDFITQINNTFQSAQDNAPAIVLLDDMDKFANENEWNCDAEEYVAVQACIDSIKNSNVFVFATANNIRKLPQSLVRSGRFDRMIEVLPPSARDACEIIKYYLSNKQLADDINLEDVTKMIRYSSCAELETIFNEAAIRAAYARKSSIAMSDLVNAVLRMEYKAPDSDTKTSDEDMHKIALHEAGHMVVCEAICHESVGLVSLRTSGRSTTGGFMRRCKDLTHKLDDVLVSLGGKAAVELYYADAHASGCQSDLRRAYEQIRTAIAESGVCGFGALEVTIDNAPYTISQSLNERTEAIVQTELERYMLKAREIILNNRDFLEKATAALMAKETLLYSDIQALRESCAVGRAS